MKELVSVIVTTYKRPNLLSGAIDSVLSQTYDNIEIIIVDDNDPSSDFRIRTSELVQTKYGAKENVHYVKMPMNSGACSARNYGVSVAKGNYINFLDDDDRLLPKKIELQMDIFLGDKEHKLAAVGCYANVVDNLGHLLYEERTDIKGNVFFYQMCDNVATTSIVLLRKEIYLLSGGFEPMYSSQEHWMLMKLFSICPNYDYVPEVLVTIYQHSGPRISTNKNWAKGAIQLYNNAAQFYNRFSKDQVIIIKKKRNSHIIRNLYLCNKSFQARKYILRRLAIGGKVTLEDFKLYVIFIFGRRIYKIVRNCFLKRWK